MNLSTITKNILLNFKEELEKEGNMEIVKNVFNRRRSNKKRV